MSRDFSFLFIYISTVFYLYVVTDSINQLMQFLIKKKINRDSYASHSNRRSEYKNHQKDLKERSVILGLLLIIYFLQ
jgi:hypothetical protein